MVETDIKAKIEKFFTQFQLRIYKKGEIILQPEDKHGGFFLKEGYVREYGISSQGVEVGLHIFMPHSYFPMVLIIADIPNRYYYEALTDVQMYNAPKDKIMRFLGKNPEVLLDLTKRVLIGLDKLTSRVEYLSYAKAYQRVVSILLYLARHFGEENNKKVNIKIKFSHEIIASLAGVTRETASREWEKLERNKLIAYKNQYIVINNIEKLKKELSS